MKYFDKKSLRNFYIKLLRQSGTPEQIAKSAAIGLFCAFFIPIGLQIPVTLLLAYILKAKKILSIIFTLPTNLYTVIFIYPLQCWIGGKICGLDLRMGTLRKLFMELAKDFSFDQFLELSTEILIGFFVGGFVFGIIFAITGYFTVYGMVMSYRQRSKNKLAARLISKHQE